MWNSLPDYVVASPTINIFKARLDKFWENQDVWYSVWCPYKLGDIKEIEKVQKRATKLIINFKNMSYSDRLQRLNLPTLKYRRLRGDKIEVFKITLEIMTQTCHLNWYIIQTLIPEVTITNYLTNHFTTTHENTVSLDV